jgi:diadenosine tetraphosphate (Ap4A) HIT family hydrolase
MNPYPDCEICERLQEAAPELVVLDDPHWLVIVRGSYQTCLGTCLVILKRHASELDELTAKEDESLIRIRNRLIKAQRAAFHPLTFNVACLKNNAFSKDPDSTPSAMGHVHWHFKPRYGTKPIAFAGKTFTDPEPGHYDKQLEHRTVDSEVASKIADAIKAKLQ